MTSLTRIAPRVWLRRGSLDSRLARGASPDEAPDLAARARQLMSRRQRTRLAEGLERSVQTVEEPSQRFDASAPLDRTAVKDARDDLVALALELRSGDPLNPRGVALVEQLLTHGDSPLYVHAPAGALRQAARQARAALLLVP